MVGFYSKKKMSNSKDVAPPYGWRDHLLRWERDATSKYLIKGSATASLDIISDCMDNMQANYPGKYHLEWANTEPNEYHLVIKFKDHNHETLWNLQYGAA